MSFQRYFSKDVGLFRRVIYGTRLYSQFLLRFCIWRRERVWVRTRVMGLEWMNNN